MLEKIGLPAKPSLRGNYWVVDASHCQSCSSQFTFLNRKHHCRRCGGLYCNTCTQHRMVLRGQGESPVRICEACKKLEEAARYELRYGHKNRAGKGKPASRSVDEVLNQILDNDGKESAKDGVSQDEDASLVGTASSDNCGGENNEIDSFTPEELRQQAVEEKNQYKVLKGEGKSAEALKAFKRAKELERQAAALELQLRKDRRKALASSSTAAQRKEEVSPEAAMRINSIPHKGKEKDDLTAELRELGWSDVDMLDTDKKPATMSLEGELINLIGHNPGKASHGKEASGLDKSQVTALKKKALMLKREGKLAEAKEELKKAKILEKQIEEQEFLADADESDDELSALMRNLDKDDHKKISTGFDMDTGFDLGDLSGFGGDINFDGNFDVTDDDLHDPDMAAALQSLGWAEDDNELDDVVSMSVPVDRESLEDEILKLKKEALSQKRSGNKAEAMSLLKKAKNLEKDLEDLDAVDMGAPDSDTADLGARTSIRNTDRKSVPKSKLMIQKELLALKKKALALRREGKLEEADNELKKGKVLEQQLEDMDSATTKQTQMDVSYNASEPLDMDLDLSSVLAPMDEDVDLTDQDEHDPAYLSVLRNLGWQDEDNSLSATEESDPPLPNSTTESVAATSVNVTVPKRRRSKFEIQRELLSLKRKALVLRRQGQETEAEELLATAKMLEDELSEIEAPKQGHPAELSETRANAEVYKQETLPTITEANENRSYQTPLKRTAEANDASEKRQVVQAGAPSTALSPSVSPDSQNSPVQQEILALKRKALILKREGKLAEARDELRKAKLLERNIQEDQPQNLADEVATEVTYSTVSSTVKEEHSPSTSTTPEGKGPPQFNPKPLSSSDRFKMQRECLTHKRNALKLRREGRTEEADAELELAKRIEAQLDEVSPQNPMPAMSADDTGVEDLFDPQLLSALQAIGLQQAPTISNVPAKAEVSNAAVKAEVSASSSSLNTTSSQERLQIEAQIKSEKMKALNLKRAGKQAEALGALRHAKQLEKKLNSLPL